MLGPFHLLRRGYPFIMSAVGLVMAACEPTDAGANETVRARAEARLERAGFELVGEPRRKGDFLVITATRESLSWRIVVDQRSGEIVGQKPIGVAPQPQD